MELDSAYAAMESGHQYDGHGDRDYRFGVHVNGSKNMMIVNDCSIFMDA